MEFIVGDKVKIKSYKEIEKMSIGKNSNDQLIFENTSIVFNPMMVRYCGNIDTIARISLNSDGYLRYKLENHEFNWLDSWLDLECLSPSRFVESFDEAEHLGD